MGCHDYFINDFIKRDKSQDKENEWESKKRIASTTILTNIEEKTKSYQSFLPTENDIKNFSEYTWLLKIKFTLAKPYTSKSETVFFPYYEVEVRKKGNTVIENRELQNPIVRDHLTGLPMVKPTTWKGNLRFAAHLCGDNDAVMRRLFGTPKDKGNDDKDNVRGRLHFFPTFFNLKHDAKINSGGNDFLKKEVITPLFRDTRTPAHGAIAVNTVPAGTEGEFYLLYVPFPRGNDFDKSQVADDLKFALDAVRAMMLDYGFSAKKTSGWGIAKDDIQENSYLKINGVENTKQGKKTEPTKEKYQEPNEKFLNFMDETGEVNSKYIEEDGKLKSQSQYKKLKECIPNGSINFRKFKEWYEKHGEEYKARKQGKPEVEKSTKPQIDTAFKFSRFGELMDQGGKIAEKIKEQGVHNGQSA